MCLFGVAQFLLSFVLVGERARRKNDVGKEQEQDQKREQRKSRCGERRRERNDTQNKVKVVPKHFCSKVDHQKVPLKNALQKVV